MFLPRCTLFFSRANLWRRKLRAGKTRPERRRRPRQSPLLRMCLYLGLRMRDMSLAVGCMRRSIFGSDYGGVVLGTGVFLRSGGAASFWTIENFNLGFFREFSRRPERCDIFVCSFSLHFYRIFPGHCKSPIIFRETSWKFPRNIVEISEKIPHLMVDGASARFHDSLGQ